MNDTSPQIAEKIREMICKKTPEERLKMGCSMYDFSKQLVTYSLLETRPGLSPRELRRELFLRFYGNDFDSTTREKIITHIDKSAYPLASCGPQRVGSHWTAQPQAVART